MLVNVLLVSNRSEDDLHSVKVPERLVNVPDAHWESARSNEAKLELVFQYGQNDFQPVEGRSSVSMGDVAMLDGEHWLCKAMGWQRLSDDEFSAYYGMSELQRFKVKW